MRTSRKKREGQKVENKLEFFIKLERSRQELPKEVVTRAKGNEKMIAVDVGSEFCGIEGQKVDKKVDFPIELG